MKRASYREAIEVIAMNDEPLVLDVEAMTGCASVLVVASIFAVESARVAGDVVRFRLNEQARLATERHAQLIGLACRRSRLASRPRR